MTYKIYSLTYTDGKSAVKAQSTLLGWFAEMLGDVFKIPVIGFCDEAKLTQVVDFMGTHPRWAITLTEEA